MRTASTVLPPTEFRPRRGTSRLYRNDFRVIVVVPGPASIYARKAAPMKPTFMKTSSMRLHSARTDPAEPDANCEYDTSADDDLDDGVGELAAHEAIADESDCDEFTHHHRISELQRDAEIRN
jgi:hypothetical protein